MINVASGATCCAWFVPGLSRYVYEIRPKLVDGAVFVWPVFFVAKGSQRERRLLGEEQVG